MMKRTDVERVRHTSAYCEVERVLAKNKDTFFTKEEIYCHMPTDEEGISLITIGSLETALRELTKMRHIECVYVRGTRYFGYAENEKRW